MRFLAVIPARLAATRLPEKPLREVGRVPLVARVLDRVRDLGLADNVVVATDSERVSAAVHGAGGHAVMTRADHPSGTDRVAEVLQRPEFAHYEAALNVQGDELFVSPDALRGAVHVVRSGTAPIGTVATPADPSVLARPEVVKVVLGESGRALYFSRAAIPFLREQGDPADVEARDAYVLRHLGVYAYTRDALLRWVALPVHPLERVERLEQLRPLAHGIPIGVATVAEAGEPGIDTPEDLVRANNRWAAAGVAGPGDPGPHCPTDRGAPDRGAPDRGAPDRGAPDPGPTDRASRPSPALSSDLRSSRSEPAR